MSEERVQKKYEQYCEKTLLNDLATPRDMRRHNRAMKKLNMLFEKQIKNDHDLSVRLFPKLLESKSMRVRNAAAQHAMLLGYDSDQSMQALAEIAFLGESVQMRADAEVFMMIYLSEHPDQSEKWHVSKLTIINQLSK